jgi:hypothetical protein
MIVQFIVSLMLFIALLFTILFILVRTVSRKLLGQPVALPSLVFSMGASIMALAIVTYGLVTGVLGLARESMRKPADPGASSVAEIIRVAVRPGYGRTSDYFEQAWEAPCIELSRTLRVGVSSAALESGDHGAVLKLTLSLNNTGDREIDFDELIRYPCILLRNDRGLCFPLEKIPETRALRLAPRTASRCSVAVPVPAGMNFTHLRTPNGEEALFSETGAGGPDPEQAR